MLIKKRVLFTGIFICLCLSGLPRMGKAEQGVFSLTLKEAVEIALANNLDIRLARIDASTGRTELEAVNSIFDTVISAEANYEDDQLEKTSSFFGTKALTSNYNLGLSRKLKSGTRLELDFAGKREHSNSAFATMNPAHSSRIELTVTQPLGRNSLGSIDRGSVAMVKLGIEKSDLTALDRIEGSLAGVQINYWKLAFARRVVELTRKMLERAENLYRIYQDRLARGLAEEVDVFASEANVKVRRITLRQTKHELSSAANLLTLALNLDTTARIEPADALQTGAAQADFIENLKQAVGLRRDYQVAWKELDSRKIKIVTARSGLWPEIDLKASLARNGVDTAGSQALRDVFSENNPDFYLGINFSWPIENRSARSQHEKALLGKERALLELKQLEMKIVRELDDRVRELNLNAEKIDEWVAIVELQQAKLEEEEKRIRQGRSNSDTLIRFQNDLLDAQLKLEGSFLDYRISRIRLERAKNAILTLLGQESILNGDYPKFTKTWDR